MKTLGIFAKTAAIVLLTAAALQAKPAPASPPNILHIHADDHRADGLNALGSRLLVTPNLDALVERGTTFTRCYTMGSMSVLASHSGCQGPSQRAGRLHLPSEGDLRSRIPDVSCRQRGNEFTPGLQSFDQSIRMADHAPDHRRGSSERHADAVLTFLSTREKHRPFYVYLAPPVPHDPRVAAPEFHQFYEANQMALPEAFMPVHPFDNGEMSVRDEQLAPWPRTMEDTKRQTADYYACVTGLDHHVGRIIERLRKEGQLENTIVIFSGDNGLSLGEHGLFGKQNLYEFGGMHVPLVIAVPGIPRGRTDALVYLMYLFPTLAELAGAKTPAGVEGRSLLPVISGQKLEVRDALYTAYKNCQRAVCNRRWKLIRYPLVNVTQLFDLNADPRELSNLADLPEHASTLREMTALLEHEMKTYGDAAPLLVANPAPSKWEPPQSNHSSKKR